MFTTVTELFTYAPVQFFISLTVDLSIMAFGVILAVRLYRSGRFDTEQGVSCAVLFIWGALILFLAVFGRRMNRETQDNCVLELFNCYRQIIAEHDRSMLSVTVQNILVFVPFGFTLSSIFKHRSRLLIPLGISFSVSLLIEVSQLLLRSGLFEVDDLFNNTLGALIGIVLYLLFGAVVKALHKKKA